VRKPIHVKVEMGFWPRLRFLLSGGIVHILLQPTALGNVVVKDVRVGGRSAPHQEEVADGAGS